MADDAEVKLGADVSDLKSQTADGATSVEASLAKIADALAGLSAKSKKTSDDVKQHTNLMQQAFDGLHENVRLRFGSINSLVEQFSTKLAAVGAALAGGALFGAMVSHLQSFNSEVTTLENVMGMASDKATQFAIALKIAGSSAEAYTGLALKMARQLKANEEEFTRNAVTTRDATGALLPLNTIMQNAFDRMQQLKSGTDQAEFALQFFGRSVQEVYKMIVILPAAQERARQLMADMNVELGPDKQAEIRRYQIEVGAFKEMLGLVGDSIAERVLPQLENLAKYFNETGPNAANVFIKVLTGMLITTDFVANGFAELWEKLKTGNEASLINERTFKDAWNTLWSDGWAAAKAVWDKGMKERERVMMEGNARILGMEADLKKRLALLAGDGSKPPPGPGPLKSGSGSFVPTPKAGTGDEMAGWENVLKASENSYNHMKLDQGSFEVWSVEMTRDYWAQVVAMTTVGTKEHLEAQNKFYDAERQVQQRAFAGYIAGLESQKAALGHNIEAKIAIGETEAAAVAQRYGAESPEAQAAYKRLVDLRQQLADQRQKIADIEAKSEEATYKHEYEMAKLAADQQVALRQISAQQRFAIEQSFLEQEHNALVNKINADMAAMAADPNSDPTKLAALKAQLLKVEQDYQKNLTTIANQAELDRKQFALQAAADTQNVFGTLLDDLITRTKTWKQAMQDAVKSLTADLNKLATDQIAKQLLGPGTSGGGFLNNIFGKIFGGGAGASGDTAATAAHTTALTADTAAYTLGTPALELMFTTLTTAGTSAAAALAAVGASSATAGLGGGIASLFGPAAAAVPAYDVGTPYVPQDTLAIVHKGEAIIPAAMNRGGAVSTGPMHMHFYISGNPDSRTLDQIQAAAARGASKSSRSVM